MPACWLLLPVSCCPSVPFEFQPKAIHYQSLARLDGVALELQYRELLRELGQGSGLIPTIFRKAQNKIQDRPSSSASSA